MKLFLCILIVASCFGAGKVKALEFSYRYRQLRELHRGFKLLQTEIQYARETLPILLERLAKEEKGLLASFYTDVCNGLEKGGNSFYECWENSVTAIYNNSSLQKEDKEILRQLGQELGKSDLQGQKSAFERFFSRIEEQIKEAEEEKKKKGKMYQSLGFYGGILIVLLLF